VLFSPITPLIFASADIADAIFRHYCHAMPLLSTAAAPLLDLPPLLLRFRYYFAITPMPPLFFTLADACQRR